MKYLDRILCVCYRTPKNKKDGVLVMDVCSILLSCCVSMFVLGVGTHSYKHHTQIYTRWRV